MSFDNNYYYNTRSFDDKVVIFYYIKILIIKFSFILLLLLSIFLINNDINKTKFIILIKENIEKVSYPAFFIVNNTYNSIYKFFGFFHNIFSLKMENKNLKRENEMLKYKLLTTLNLSEDNRKLKQILNFINYENNVISYTLKPVFIEKNKFINKLKINKNIDINISNGDLAFDVNGYFIGKIINTTNNSAEILLITDPASRIPVIIGNSKTKAILGGNNSNYLNIINVLGNELNIREGDLVFSTNDGNILMENLYIGKIEKIKDSFKIRINDKFNFIDFITVIKNNLL